MRPSPYSVNIGQNVEQKLLSMYPRKFHWTNTPVHTLLGSLAHRTCKSSTSMRAAPGLSSMIVADSVRSLCPSSDVQRSKSVAQVGCNALLINTPSTLSKADSGGSIRCRPYFRTAPSICAASNRPARPSASISKYFPLTRSVTNFLRIGIKCLGRDMANTNVHASTINSLDHHTAAYPNQSAY